MRQIVESSGLQLEERVVHIWRCACVVKGGRRFSFAAMAVVGNGDGVAGVGYGKAREVPAAIEKAVKNAKKHLFRFPVQGGTIPHEIIGHYGSSRVALIPAMPGTGVIAGEAVRAVAESVGIRNLLSKSFGRNNPKNLVHAAFDGLNRLRAFETVKELRGVEVDYQAIKAQTVGFVAAGVPSAAEGHSAGRRGGDRGDRGGGGGGDRGRRGGGRRGGNGRGGGGRGRPAPHQAAAPQAGESAQAPVPPAGAGPSAPPAPPASPAGGAQGPEQSSSGAAPSQS